MQKSLITERLNHWSSFSSTLKRTAWCGAARSWNPAPEKLPLLSTSCTTWALNHWDKNITAAYLCVSPRHWAPSPSLHLHFVAHAKHCHPKSPTNLPPYGSSPQKATAVAWQSHTAPSASAGHVVEERDGLPSLPAHSIPPCLPSIQILHPMSLRSPPPLPSQKKKNPPDNFKEWRVPQRLDLWTPAVVMATTANFVFEDGNGGGPGWVFGKGLWW